MIGEIASRGAEAGDCAVCRFWTLAPDGRCVCGNTASEMYHKGADADYGCDKWENCREYCDGKACAECDAPAYTTEPPR